MSMISSRGRDGGEGNGDGDGEATKDEAIGDMVFLGVLGGDFRMVRTLGCGMGGEFI